MTAWSASEIDEYFKNIIPVMYQGNGVTMGADIELKCWYFHTIKYKVDWFWARKTFWVYDQNDHNSKILFSSPICGDLSMLCHVDDGAVLYCDAETVDGFVERLLAMRVFE